MIISVIKPDGSLIHHNFIVGVWEDDRTGNLVLLHKDDSKREYEKGAWAKFNGARVTVGPTMRFEPTEKA